MRGMVRRALGLGVVAAVLIALPISTGRSAPEGASLAMVGWSRRPVSFDLISTDQSGTLRHTLLSRGLLGLPAPYPGDAPSWSPDGSLLAFTALVGTVHKRYYTGPRTKIFVVSAEGTGLRPVPGTANGASPVFAPDGRTIAFAVQRHRPRPHRRGGGNATSESEAVWITDLEGTTKRQVTPWRNGLKMVPSSFSPDGTRLAATRVARAGIGEAVTIRLKGGKMVVLARNALHPVYSPDGSEVAYLGGHFRTARTRHGKTRATLTDLFTMRADGTGSQRLTRTPKAVEIAPSWDPSGRRLAFTRLGNPLTAPGARALGGDVMEVNADGSCLTKILPSRDVAYFGATWQPGPGREAGPITC
jgi:Tol biopolymer transport system component